MRFPPLAQVTGLDGEGFDRRYKFWKLGEFAASVAADPRFALCGTAAPLMAIIESGNWPATARPGLLGRLQNFMSPAP